MRKGKAALEGSLRVSASNVIVYATSNRRYPVGSKYTDATEEKLAFSYRFGITLSFPRTSREAYIAIVRRLASEAGIQIDHGHLQDLALQVSNFWLAHAARKSSCASFLTLIRILTFFVSYSLTRSGPLGKTETRTVLAAAQRGNLLTFWPVNKP